MGMEYTVKPQKKYTLGTIKIQLLCPGKVLFSEVQKYRKTNYWDLEKCPVWKGLLYYVPILEGPLSDFLLYYLFYHYVAACRLNTDCFCA